MHCYQYIDLSLISREGLRVLLDDALACLLLSRELKKWYGSQSGVVVIKLVKHKDMG